MKNLNIFWFRRDLRLHDNHGLYKALIEAGNVQPIFIFDTDILNKLEDRTDRRVQFVHDAVIELDKELKTFGSSLWVFCGKPAEIFEQLVKDREIGSVHTNHDHEPYGICRDAGIHEFLEENGIGFKTFKDHSIFERDEVLKDDGTPYTVYTPYSNKWKTRLQAEPIVQYPSEQHLAELHSAKARAIPSVYDIGFQQVDLDIPSKTVSVNLLKDYEKDRDIPSINGTGRISVHLRFGTISIREMMKLGMAHSEKWLNELIWREFYMMILYQFPQVVNKAFKPKYDLVDWRIDESGFQAWCEGRTGFPIVDAGMRELNKTGFMHNRVRMITASFLCKDLLTDWRWGEAYFAQKLLDFELSSNNGGWQWASSSGCDAAPYFRIFNPDLQTKKFDPALEYIRKWVLEFEELDYPQPIVVHRAARVRTIQAYKKALQK